MRILHADDDEEILELGRLYLSMFHDGLEIESLTSAKAAIHY